MSRGSEKTKQKQAPTVNHLLDPSNNIERKQQQDEEGAMSPALSLAYADIAKKKPKVVKMTFEIDYEIAKKMNKISKKFGYGFKKRLANNGILSELNKIEQEIYNNSNNPS